MIYIQCDCCGARESLVIQDTTLDIPRGWRRVTTFIQESNTNDHQFAHAESERAHSCPDCNLHMTIEEQAAAEHEARLLRMAQQDSATQK